MQTMQLVLLYNFVFGSFSVRGLYAEIIRRFILTRKGGTPVSTPSDQGTDGGSLMQTPCHQRTTCNSVANNQIISHQSPIHNGFPSLSD